jgi:hypothetical protein
MSNINPQNIDGTYPIAGQDNDSQGFRNNFTNTVNNFVFAAAELTDLQNNAILKAPLTSVGQTTLNNNLNNAQLIGAQLLESTYTLNNLTTPSGNLQVSWASGQFQTVTLSSSTNMSFDTSWAGLSGFWTWIRLKITVSTSSVALSLPAAVSINTANIQGVSGQTVTLPTGIYEFEFATPDGGTTITIRDLLRNYNTEIAGNSATFVTANITGNLTATIITTAPGSNGNLTLDPDGTADVVLPSNTALWLLDPTPSTNTTSGALVNYGGAGIAGNVYSGAYINAASGIVNSGLQIETGYQQIKPTANVAVTVNTNVNRVLIHPTGTIISFGANVTLPNTQVDGTIVSISSNVTIAQLAVTPNWNGVVTVSPFGNATSVTSGTVSRYMYIAADKIWYKIA